jgi:hypothetical protein
VKTAVMRMSESIMRNPRRADAFSALKQRGRLLPRSRDELLDLPDHVHLASSAWSRPTSSARAWSA